MVTEMVFVVILTYALASYLLRSDGIHDYDTIEAVIRGRGGEGWNLTNARVHDSRQHQYARSARHQQIYYVGGS
uniref:Putative secreted peptide n=1 Tax=Anopheles braziliensis TaxID=58242 RepID=A0A2M3ZS58_9DIPT